MATATPRAYPHTLNSAHAALETPRCGCGYERDSPMVRAEPSYGFGGWLCLVIGVTTRPDCITFRCRRCDTVIEESSALDILERAC